MWILKSIKVSKLKLFCNCFKEDNAHAATITERNIDAVSHIHTLSYMYSVVSSHQTQGESVNWLRYGINIG